MTSTSEKKSSSPVTIAREGAVAIVTMNRPEKRNALDLAMRGAIAEAFRALSTDPEVRVILITGGDDVFAAGADLSILVDQSPQSLAELDLPSFWAPVANCEKPVVAAVNGYCLGAGCELMMMCDLVVVDDTAQIGQPECSVGIMPGAGGTQRLIRALGKPMASLMTMCGELISAERAYQLGLAGDISAANGALPQALKRAQKIAKMPPKAIQAIKRSLKLGADLPLNEALAFENREFLLLFDTQDQTEGMQAFLEKRKPVFTGK